MGGWPSLFPILPVRPLSLTKWTTQRTLIKPPFASSRSPGEVAAPSYYYFWGGVEAMAPESQRDSVPNHSCSLLPASQLGPISLSKSHLDEAPALLNATLISTFFSTTLISTFFSIGPSFSICLENLSFPTRH